MIFKHRFTLIALMTLLMASLAGCSQDEPSQPDVKNDGVILRLAIDTGLNPSSRADAPDFFEKPDGDFEKMYTLRVILINNENEIEANKLVRTTEYGSPINDNLEFKVKSGNKSIYLVANEASLTVPDDYAGSYDSGKYPNATAFLDDMFKVNSTFSSSILSNWLVSLPGNGQQEVTQSMYTDNPNANGLPLTEFFTFNVGATPEHNQYDETQTVQLFLTRAAAKATFNINVDGNYKGSGVNVTGIRLNGLNVQQYVFPNKATYAVKNEDGTIETIEKEAVIYPGLPSAIKQVNRFLTSFATPERHFQATGASMVMNLPEKDFVEIKAGAKETFGPVYFTESLMPNTTARFNVQVQLDGENWLDAKPLGVGDGNNILLVNGAQAIARNTHLQINIGFTDNDITATVSLVPYIGVELKPTFGF